MLKDREAYWIGGIFAYSLKEFVEKVIYNDPATIVFWKDGTKTVVKASENDYYDEQTGFLMCLAKKVFGDDFRKIMNRYVWEDLDRRREERRIRERSRKAIEEMRKMRKIPYGG